MVDINQSQSYQDQTSASIFLTPHQDSKKSLSETNGLTYDQALTRAGGFGLFQCFSTLFMLIAYLSNGYIFYALTYLELFPEYICPGGEGTCGPKDKCTNENIQVDWSSDKSLHNWVELFNLECVDSIKIGLLGSMYFAGWTVGCFFVPRLGDLMGRRIPCLVSNVFSCFVYLGLVLSKNLDFSIAMFFFLGLTCPAKSNIIYVYMLELIPVKFQTAVGTMMLIFDGGSTLIITIYFRFISKNWLPFQIWGLTLTAISTVAMFLVPESPKYLWSAKKFKEAKEKLEFIARFNRNINYNRKFKFETEIQEEQGNRKQISASYNSLSNSQEIMKMADKINYTNDTLKPTQIDTSALLMKDGAYSPTEIEQERQQQNQADNSLDAQPPQQQQPSGKLGDLFRDKTHLQNLIIISFLWVVASFDYFLINFQMKYIDGDMYINTIVSCVSEVVAYIVSGALYNTIGTKISFIGSFVLAIIGSIFYITLGDTYKGLIPVMILSAKFGISGAFNLVYLANTLFPPIYAATTFGIFNIFARLASMLAPQFAEFHKPLPMIIFCIMAGAALIVSLFIKKPKIQE